MIFGICNLSIVPLRLEPNETTELISQVLYGELFKVLEKRKTWSRIRLSDDDCEGWIDNKQYSEISGEIYKIHNDSRHILSSDVIEYVKDNSNNHLLTIPLGSVLNCLEFLDHSFDGNTISIQLEKSQLTENAFLYLNTPYLMGGRTPFGIDNSGFTQMVYKLNGHKLFRKADLQATQGVPLSFIEESEAGDLAFFDDKDGNINHVGIILEDNYIIHAYGKVRIDRLDHTGIYDANLGVYTHKLRVIKKII